MYLRNLKTTKTDTKYPLFFALRQSLCSPGWHRSHYIDQAGVKLTKTHLPLPVLGLKELGHYAWPIHFLDLSSVETKSLLNKQPVCLATCSNPIASAFKGFCTRLSHLLCFLSLSRPSTSHSCLLTFLQISMELTEEPKQALN